MKKMNRNVKAIAARIGAAALLSAVMGTTAFGGTWQTTAGGWQYLADNGIPMDQIRYMSHTLPCKLLGIEP